MKLSQNWIIANITKDLEFNKEKMEQYKKEGNNKLKTYYQGIVKGLEMALKSIEESYK